MDATHELEEIRQAIHDAKAETEQAGARLEDAGCSLDTLSRRLDTIEAAAKTPPADRSLVVDAALDGLDSIKAWHEAGRPPAGNGNWTAEELAEAYVNDVTALLALLGETLQT